MKKQDRWDSLIQYYAERVGLPWETVKRQVLAESSGDPWAVSEAGAKGLLQLMPMTAVELQVRDPFHPEESIRGGTEYLAKLHASVAMLVGAQAVDPEDPLRFALAAYNCGYGYVRRALRSVLDKGLVVSWRNFCLELPHAQIGTKRPRAQLVIQYVERVLPLRESSGGSLPV